MGVCSNRNQDESDTSPHMKQEYFVLRKAIKVLQKSSILHGRHFVLNILLHNLWFLNCKVTLIAIVQYSNIQYSNNFDIQILSHLIIKKWYIFNQNGKIQSFTSSTVCRDKCAAIACFAREKFKRLISFTFRRQSQMQRCSRPPIFSGKNSNWFMLLVFLQ